MTRVQTGLERLIESPPKWIFGNRIGLLANPASVDAGLRHARELIDRKSAKIISAIGLDNISVGL